MTNTLNNVPREWFDRVHALLYKVAYENTPEGLEAECLGSFIPDILSAPSPAGVDGLEVVGYIQRGGIDGAEWEEGGAPQSVPVTPVADAQAIIDGLRGENGKLQDQLHATQLKVGRYADQRDQLAGFLLAASKASSAAEVGLIVDAALAELPK